MTMPNFLEDNKRMEKQIPITIEIGNVEYRLHQLKTVEPYFSAVERGEKTFEIRKYDRDYRVGDLLQLIQYDPGANEFGRVIIKQITYMLTDAPYVPDGYVALGFR